MTTKLLILAAMASAASHAPGQTPSATPTTIYNFSGCTGAVPPECDGTSPYGGLVIGSSGVLYGVTVYGGNPESFQGNAQGGGTVFSITPPATPAGNWTEAVLYRFLGGPGDGEYPMALVLGGGGVLYGTTSSGGTGSCQIFTNPPTTTGCGVVFSLTPPTTPTGAWTESVLYNFDYDDASGSSLLSGSDGVLYGTTAGTAQSLGCGYVFSLTPPAGSVGNWAVAGLYTFVAGPGQSCASSGLVIGGGGVLYGTEYISGPPHAVPSAVVFSLAPPAVPGGSWAENSLYSFDGSNQVSLVPGGGGVLYGTALTTANPPAYGGIVFSLTPPAQPGGSWTEVTLYSATDSDGVLGGLAIGNGGALYVLSNAGMFSLRPPAIPGGAWTKAILNSFSSGGGVFLTIGSDGIVYGTAEKSGVYGDGTVFSLEVPIPQPSINPGGAVSAGSYTAPVAPGSIASAFGNFFVPPLSANQSPLPAALSDLSLTFDNTTSAPLLFVSGGQVNLQVPWELAGLSQANLAATLSGQTGAAQTVNLATFAPAIFTMNSQGTGQGAILDESNHLVDATNPATPGSTVLQIFCTGLGPVTNQPPTGSPAPLTPLSYTTATPAVTIGGVSAEVSFAGLAPGYVGLYQVNAAVPPGLAAGNAVPVVISMGGAASNTATIAVE